MGLDGAAGFDRRAPAPHPSRARALHEADLTDTPRRSTRSSRDGRVRAHTTIRGSSVRAGIRTCGPAKLPDAGAAERGVPDRPVALHRVDGHAILANAKAMQLAGVTALTPDPAGGRIVHDERGAPTGLFIDNAMPLILAASPLPSANNLRAASQARSASVTAGASPPSPRRAPRRRRSPSSSRSPTGERSTCASTRCSADGRRAVDGALRARSASVRGRRPARRSAP